MRSNRNTFVHRTNISFRKSEIPSTTRRISHLRSKYFMQRHFNGVAFIPTVTDVTPPLDSSKGRLGKTVVSSSIFNHSRLYLSLSLAVARQLPRQREPRKCVAVGDVKTANDSRADDIRPYETGVNLYDDYFSFIHIYFESQIRRARCPHRAAGSAGINGDISLPLEGEGGTAKP